ncbi:MAG: AbrB/MazE/SpoVT family DNA-binding domain-containing protein [Clostridia bacterium]|nr:AbrB/MazE/SpoVT family DNA-binding domain-containing protein [Clostridia bacterium]
MDRKLDIPNAPAGKHIFGTVTVGERGQIVIPKKARDLFDIKPGDSLIVLGDETQGIAIMKADIISKMLSGLMNMMNAPAAEEEE